MKPHLLPVRLTSASVAMALVLVGLAASGPVTHGVLRVGPEASVRRLAAASGPTDDPTLAGQWYLRAVHAFEFWPVPAPSFAPVRVAVLDSGIDGAHPDFHGLVVAARSFVGGSALTDTVGHGTMVAGEIVAAAGDRPDGGQSTVPVRLVVGKIVAADGSIDVTAEARAIRWAADQGARVINLSLGATRDPTNPTLDEYSPLEDAAVQYAYRKGALVVAVTGNCADTCPYNFADYPAALSHVLAVSAFDRGGSTPTFSNRDPRRNDLAAPGAGIISTFPSALSEPGCAEPGYSSCATDPAYRQADGTSFAAPLASAAAALLLALKPTLTPGQVVSILEHTTDPTVGAVHNAATGYGHLDIAKALEALTGPLPPANSAAGVLASTAIFRFGGARDTVRATLDFYDDPLDVYAVHAEQRQLITATVGGPVASGGVLLSLFAPPLTGAQGPERNTYRPPIAVTRSGSRPSLTFRAHVTGWYRLDVTAVGRRSGTYRLLVGVAGSRRSIPSSSAASRGE